MFDAAPVADRHGSPICRANCPEPIQARMDDLVGFESVAARFAGTGNAGFSGDGGKATAAEDEEYAELHHPLPAAN